jgi:SPP1 family predicted phage head-tail adaptor
VLSRAGASAAGRLRFRLTLEKATASPDGAGGSTLGWTAAATLFADLTPVKAEERQSGEGIYGLTRYRIVIRHRDDVAAGDRLRLGDRVFSIKSVSDPDEDRRFLVCLAEEEGRP